MRILIVDDEPGLAAGLAQWLEENGWPKPGVATTAEEAVSWVNQNGIDLLITDVVMEPIDGFALREAIAPKKPKMKTIFISGYDLSGYADRVAGAPVLAKPIQGELLDETIRTLYETPTTPKAVTQAVSLPVQPPASQAAAPRVAVPKATPGAAKPAAAQPPVAPSVRPAVSAAQPSVAAAKPVAGAAKPAVAPSAKPVAAKAAVVSAVREGLPADELVGATLGSYQITGKMEQLPEGGLYQATQTAIGRTVRLYVLDRNQAADPAAVERFLTSAKTKAAVSHPYILTVYEAGHEGQVYFYSAEFIACRSLAQIKAAGEKLDEKTALQAIKVAAEALAYLQENNIAHPLIGPSDILITDQRRPRIANIAVTEITEGAYSTEQQMAALGQTIAEVVPVGGELGVGVLARALASQPSSIGGWKDLIQSVERAAPTAAPKDVEKLEAQEQEKDRIILLAQRQQRRKLMVSSAVTLLLLLMMGGAAYWWLFLRFSVVKDFNVMKEIPAGEFIYQDGQKIALPTFYIDEYEVTIGQYAKFLAYLKAHPEEAAKFDHPNQVPGKSHVPNQWADEDLPSGPMLGYYARAKGWGRYKGVPLDLNSPVFGIDWYDAYAYAKWKGRRLPTEQEWEKAARGANGFKYPWGNDPNPKLVNSGADANPNPAKGGEVDGFKKWSPVDAVKGDKSPFGVMGMAGNVSEWTATEDSTSKNPVARGGNFKNPNYDLTRRVTDVIAEVSGENLGFRTVSDTPPAPAK